MKKIIFLLLLAFASVAFSQSIPQKIVYQGVLIDNTGKPVDQNDLFINFEITDGSNPPLWSNSSPIKVNVKGGLFATTLDLSSIDPKDLNKPLTLKIIPNGMQPFSVDFTATMYALNVADNAISSEKIRTDAVTNDKIKDDEITGAKIKDNQINTNHIIDRKITPSKIEPGPIGEETFLSTSSDGNVQWLPMGIPIGTIIAYGLDYEKNKTQLNEQGWYLCDGTKYDGTNSTPDLRGMFLRGMQAGRSSEKGDITEPNRKLLSEQDDAFQGHWHNISSRSDKPQGGGGAQAPFYEGGGFTSSSDTMVRNAITDGKNGIPKTASETRPKNIAVYYLMKVR